MTTQRICQHPHCANSIPEGSHGLRKYCSAKCRHATSQARYMATDKGREANARGVRTWYERQKTPGTVYILVAPDGSSYIGSTKNSLRRRLWTHRAKARAGSGYPVHEHLRATDFEDWEISALECMPAEVDRQYLREREQVWIDRMRPSLNAISAVRGGAIH